jgi:probable phosphoglycerate mutase
METAAPIAKLQKMELRQTNEFGEWYLGEWQGLSLDEAAQRNDWKRFHHYRSGVRAPGGDLMIELQARVIRQMECVSRRHQGKCIAIISHAEPIRAALAHFLGVALDLALRIEVSPGSVSVVEIDEWGPRVLCTNGTGELLI